MEVVSITRLRAIGIEVEARGKLLSVVGVPSLTARQRRVCMYLC